MKIFVGKVLTEWLHGFSVAIVLIALAYWWYTQDPASAIVLCGVLQAIDLLWKVLLFFWLKNWPVCPVEKLTVNKAGPVGESEKLTLKVSYRYRVGDQDFHGSCVNPFQVTGFDEVEIEIACQQLRKTKEIHYWNSLPNASFIQNPSFGDLIRLMCWNPIAFSAFVLILWSMYNTISNC